MAKKDDVLFARSANTSVFGKCDEHIPKTPVPESVKLDVTKRWRELGFSSCAEYVRQLVLIDLYGKDMLKSLHDARLDAMTTNGDE